MRDDMLRKQRLARQRAALRKRDLLVLGASLLAHVLLLLILPGFTTTLHPPPVLMVELNPPTLVQVEPSAGATAPDYAPVPAGEGLASPAPAPAENKVQPQHKPAAQPAKTAAKPAQTRPAAVKPTVKPAVKPSAKPQSSGVQSTAGQDAPQVVKPQPTVAPQKKPEQPAPAKKPTPQPKDSPPAKPTKPADPAPAKPADGGAAPAKPADTGGGKAEPGSAPGGSGSGSGGSGTGGGAQKDEGQPGTGGQPGPVAAPDPGPPAPPPGPSQHELDLLDDYGNKALKRIKGQARNSEQGAKGTVGFEFEVDRKGRLLDVRVVDSSGHNNLDNDVLEAARAAFNESFEIIPFPADIKVSKWVFRRSIKYPLY